MRVRQGGHNIPDHVVTRRFQTGMRNFQEIYRYSVDIWQWYDNSDEIPVLGDEGENL